MIANVGNNDLSVLLVGSAAPGALEIAYFESIQTFGKVGVDFFDVDAVRGREKYAGILQRALRRAIVTLSRPIVAKRLLRHLAAHKYDAIVVFKGADFSLHDLEQSRKAAGKSVWINLNPDNPLSLASKGSANENIRLAIAFFDLYILWTPLLLPSLEETGVSRTAVLPFGFNSSEHFLESTPQRQAAPYFLFAGAWDIERERTLESVADVRFKIFGYGWNRVRRGSPLRKYVDARNIYGAALRRAVADAIACVNLLRPQNQGSHNMRTFEIPAMGGLLLTQRTTEQQSFFPEEEASLMFGDSEELGNQLSRILTAPDQFGHIRQRGYELARAHTYTNRARELLTLVTSTLSFHR